MDKAQFMNRVFKDTLHALTSGYGNRISPITHTTKFHDGEDWGVYRIPGKLMFSPVFGTVIANGYTLAMGYYIKIKTPYGIPRLQHMAGKSPVPVGREVCPGTLIGVCGMTGASTGIHLHIAYRTLLNVSISPEQFFSMYGEFYLYNGTFPVSTVSRTRGSFADKKHWQEFLCWYGPNTTVDGDFATDTEKWTMEFQRLNGLTPDGVVGPLTRAKAKTVRK